MVQNSAHHALPFQLGVFEIDQQTQVEPCDCQVTDHLGQVGFVECRYHFGVYNNLPINNQIWDEQPDRLAFVMDIESALLIYG